MSPCLILFLSTRLRLALWRVDQNPEKRTSIRMAVYMCLHLITSEYSRIRLERITTSYFFPSYSERPTVVASMRDTGKAAGYHLVVRIFSHNFRRAFEKMSMIFYDYSIILSM